MFSIGSLLSEGYSHEASEAEQKHDRGLCSAFLVLVSFHRLPLPSPKFPSLAAESPLRAHARRRGRRCKHIIGREEHDCHFVAMCSDRGAIGANFE